jgi:hypothetical protein
MMPVMPEGWGVDQVARMKDILWAHPEWTIGCDRDRGVFRAVSKDGGEPIECRELSDVLDELERRWSA